MSKITREIVLYTLAMGLALAVDVVTLTALVELAGMRYLPAAACGFTVGGLVAYTLCIRYIFSYRRIEDRRLEAMTFLVLGIAGLGVSLAGMWLGVEILGLHYLVSKAVAAGLSFLSNYGLRRLVLFTALPRQQPGRS